MGCRPIWYTFSEILEITVLDFVHYGPASARRNVMWFQNDYHAPRFSSNAGEALRVNTSQSAPANRQSVLAPIATTITAQRLPALSIFSQMLNSVCASAPPTIIEKRDNKTASKPYSKTTLFMTTLVRVPNAWRTVASYTCRWRFTATTLAITKMLAHRLTSTPAPHSKESTAMTPIPSQYE
jgi:hypothetical protein